MAALEYADRTGVNNANWRGGAETQCDQCGCKIWVTPSRAARDKRHFCGSPCRNLWLSNNITGDKIASWRGGRITKNCLHCGERFEVERAEDARHNTKYCSRDCWRSANKSKIDWRECLNCGEIFTPRRTAVVGKYCSRACKHTAQTKIRTEADVAKRLLELRVACLMGYSLKGRKAGCRWEKLVGYTLAELMSHLEALFQPGMTWANIGDWHIDHKTPRSAFNYSTPDEPAFLECWALDNLQPLWAVDNMRKGARLDWQPTA